MTHIDPQYVLALGAVVIGWIKLSQDRTIGRLEGEMKALHTMVAALITANTNKTEHGPRRTDAASAFMKGTT
jgi:hypothetical protein